MTVHLSVVGRKNSGKTTLMKGLIADGSTGRRAVPQR